MPSKRSPASAVALGGVLAALAVTVMCMGTLIPVATYVCPMLCILLLEVFRRLCGSRYGWAWYGAAAILSLLMAPDKEAALVFAGMGWYPMGKPWLDKRKLPWLWKGILFNGVILMLYTLVMKLLGLNRVLEEFAAMGTVLTLVTLALGNVVFFLMDKVLGRKFGRK